MKMNKKCVANLTMLIAVLFLAACTPENITETTETYDNSTSLVNLASVYCEDLGYTLESVERDGGEDVDCVFPDGSSCPQWDFLAGRCGHSHSYCEKQGGTLEEGIGNTGLCRFMDGSTCDEYAFFSGDCTQGENPDEMNAYPIKTEEEAETGYPIEDNVIQNIEEARDAVLDFLVQSFSLPSFGDWADEDSSQGGDEDRPTTIQAYTSGSWTVEVEFEPAAPLVSSYTVRVTNQSENFSWEGEINLYGEITELISSL